MDLQKLSAIVSPCPDSESLSTLDPELPLQKLFVRNLLMIAFNKHDWSWFGECQGPTQSNLCTGCFGALGYRTSRLVRDLREERGSCFHFLSNMTQRLRGHFIFQLSYQWKNLQTVEAAIAQHIRTIQTEPVTEVSPCADASCEPVLFLAMKHRVSAPV